MVWLMAFMTFIGWGTGDIFGVIATRKIGPFATSILVFIIGFVISTLYIPFTPNTLSVYTLPLLIINIILGTCYVMGNLFVNIAFQKTTASMVGVVIQSFPAAVLILSAMVYGDAITIPQAVAIAMVFGGIALLSLDPKDFRHTLLRTDVGLRYALAATVLFAFYFTFLRNVITAVGWFWPNYISFLMFPVVLLYLKVKNIKPDLRTTPSVYGAITLAALLLRSGDIAFNYGLSLGQSAIMVPVSGASPILFVVLSYLVFRERVRNLQWTGIILTLLGLMILASV